MTVDRPFFKNGTPSALYFYSGTYSSAPDPSSLQTGTTAWFTDKPDSNGGAFVVRGTSTPGTNIWDSVGGGPVAIDTYANIEANYSGAIWSGCKAFSSDLKAPLWHNGSRWCLDSAYTSLYASRIGFIYFGCSGATATQSGNTVTVSQTAHGLTSDYNGYSINLYQLSGSFAETNGWYTEFNYINANTFSCVSTVSNTVSVPQSLTSNTAETFAPDLFTVPQNLMQNGMSLSSLLNWRCKSNGNTKTNRFYFCGLLIGTTTGTTFTSITGANANSVLFLYPDQNKFFVPGVSTAAETLTNRKFTNSVQLANGGDWAVFIPRSIYAFEGRL